MIPALRLSALLLLASAPGARADLYKWTDEKGVVHVGSKPPAKASAKSQVKRIKSGPPPSSTPAPAAEGRDLSNLKGAPAAAAPRSVELFITSWCGYCRQAEAYLSGRGIPYQAFDVEADAAAAARARAAGWTGGVPFALIGGRPVRGFSKSTYDRHLP